MKINLLTLLCIAVLCVTLALGLWPFHSPRNGVSWLRTHDGLQFGKYGTVISSSPIQIAGPQKNDPEASLEVWLRPNRIWDFGTFLAFYKPENLFQFSLYQSQTDLSIRTKRDDDPNRVGTADFFVKDVFHRGPRPVFLTITAGRDGIRIYTDGILAAAAAHFPLSAKNLNARFVLGDSPGQSDSWRGELLGLAIYSRQLTATQAFHDCVTWKQQGRPELTGDEGNVALYLFDEHAGNVVSNKARSGVALYIPEKYTVMDQIFLEPLWTEFSMTRNYWSAVLKNIVGFIPFGFCFYAYATRTLSIKRPTLITVALGTAVSLTIEVLQAHLPTRDSGTTDLATNTLGTWMGAVSFDLLAPALARIFPWLSFSSSLRG